MIRSSEVWGGLFWLGLGAFVVWTGRDLGLGKVNDPGSGFALFWVGLLLMMFAALIVLNALREPGAALSELWRGTRWGKVMIVVALLLAFGIIFDQIGFAAGAIILLLILMLVVDPVRPVVAIPVAVLAPLAIFFIVTKWLKVQMPRGILAPWLG